VYFGFTIFRKLPQRHRFVIYLLLSVGLYVRVRNRRRGCRSRSIWRWRELVVVMRSTSFSVSTIGARRQSAAATDFPTPSDSYFISRCLYDDTASQREPSSSDDTQLTAGVTRPTGTVRHLESWSPPSRERLHSLRSLSCLNFSTLNDFNEHSWYTQQRILVS